jgi:hypothetical protein
MVLLDGTGLVPDLFRAVIPSCRFRAVLDLEYESDAVVAI